MEVEVHEAKTHFSRLLQRIATGEEVIITRGGQPVARLVAFGAATSPRVLGSEVGRFSVPDDFDAPLPAGALDAFES